MSIADDFIKDIKKITQTITMEDSLRDKLNSGRKLVVKFGADPSRPDLHLGHYVPLRVLKKLQDLGHEIVFLIGDFTAMIGDPSGKSKTRPSLTFEESRKNAETYFEQVGKVLDIQKTKIVYNSEWYNNHTFQDVLKLGANYTLARILERDDFAKRFSENQPISIHELFYPLMQGFDSVELKADIELGGNDQLFNVLIGRDLQKSYGQPSQDIITTPLLVGLDGKEKMSKSLNNYIGFTDSSDVMYEKCMRIPDELMLTYFMLTTDCDEEEVKALINTSIIDAHKKYADIITSFFHSPEQSHNAQLRYEEVSKGGIPQNIETIKHDKISDTILSLVMSAKLCNSSSEARRLIAGGGIKVDNTPITDFNQLIDLSKEVIVKKGKNKFVKFVF